MGLVLTMLFPLHVGGTVVAMRAFQADALLGAVSARRLSTLILPPVLAGLLAGHPDANAEVLSSVRVVAFGGAPLSARRQQAVADRFPHCTVGQGWGMTELAVGATTPRTGITNRVGSVGRLLPNTCLRVVDPMTDADLGVDEVGELWVRGPQTMLGYLGRPEETAATLDADGWVHTGDLGRVDAEGWVFVLDRIKDLIKVKGYQVPPAELEALLSCHPQVADAAVVGVQTGEDEEVPVAHVVARDPGGIDPEAVRAWFAGQVAPYKRLHAVHVCERLPRTPSGKLLRRSLGPH
jgi:acyl-CoA synthetase (AMP-forming)/AMP-acid ligase II